MDDHARRVLGPLLRRWVEFNDGRGTLLDLSRVSEQAAQALDNASAPMPSLLARAAVDLEYAFHATEPEQHRTEAQRILGPILAQLDG